LIAEKMLAFLQLLEQKYPMCNLILWRCNVTLLEIQSLLELLEILSSKGFPFTIELLLYSQTLQCSNDTPLT
jgi:hypothetical protein